ncbi:MAG TPA: hypothetical protein VEK79_17005 [Thermoanaerobaculia bacterium]|nr:hypothetical protein [Thermoanaerobaculia bacterium]
MIRTTTKAAAFAACLLATGAFADTYPNSVKYKDTGVPNVTAVTSIASIEARALLNRDDTTDVEVTTGSFEGDAPSGYVTKVKVGIPTADGIQPVNFNHPESPAFSGNVSGVIIGDIVTIDAQVRGLNNGTDHAVAQATVAKRPDLAVQSLSPPGVAITNNVATVRTTIVERNRSVGARANVRLLIDGVEVDRAENIWVNAGGRVTVTFAPILEAEAGWHNFTVVVDSMNPGDWNDADNTRTVEAEVYNVLGEFYNWSASASEEEFELYDYQKRSWTERTRHEQGVRQSFSFDGVIRAAVNLGSVTVTASGTTDGNALFTKSWNDFFVFSTPVGSTCARSSESPFIRVCRDRNGVVAVEIEYGNDDAVYRSWGWATRQNPFAPEEPMFTWDDTRESHTLQSRFGATVALDFTVTDGTNHWTAEPFLASLTSSSTSSSSPYACNFDSFTQETICRERRNASNMRSGSASGTSQ